MTTRSKLAAAFICAIAAFSMASTAGAWGDKTKDKTKTSESQMRMHAFDRSEVISFDMKSPNLSADEKEKLQNLITAVGTDNIDRIEIAAWSDKAFPRKGSDLPKADRDLATRRANVISDYLKETLDVSTMKISTYNMAETSNWLARTFRTDDAELKSIFSKETEPVLDRGEFNVIAREGSPSKAVVVIVQK